MPKITYAKAGVNIEREELAIKPICRWMEKTFKFREGKTGEVINDIGSFANVIDMGGFGLAMCMDGVGSKVLVAQELEKYDTIGIDLVAMNVNDLICIGAEPIAMVDYIAAKQIDADIIRDIGIGIYEGAKLAQVAVIGGETATMPEIINGVENRGFDIAGTAIGIVQKDKIITGEDINAGDAVLGLASSGIHSNGLTLARKVIPKTMWMKLLNPTRIYVKDVMNLIEEYNVNGMVHGLSHITGGGVRNLNRTTELGFYLDNMPEPQMIFKKIQELADISDHEMYKTFNMGIGLCAIVDESIADEIIDKYGNSREYGSGYIRRIGSVVKDPGIKIVKNDEEIKI